MPSTIFWDNDGILVHTEPLYFAATAEILAEIDITLTRDWYVHEKLKHNKNAFDFAKAEGYTDEQILEMKGRRNNRYTQMLQDNVPLIDGVVETLEKLQGQFLMGIVSNSQRVHFDIIMEKTGLLQYFDFTVLSMEVGRSKPYPDPYLHAMKQVGRVPEDCVVIEDSEMGVKAATAAGITCFAIPNDLSEGGDFSLSRAVLNDITELPDILDLEKGNMYST